MLSVDPAKEYLMQITLNGTAETIDEVVPGDRLDRAVEDARAKYPSFRRIVVYDADTKDAVAFIRQ